ncbi:MAG: winged helix-turn-helix transcriptional regulator, partial [Elusimicrobia bacterium]|nr:winged helix-turn-helix transcriptional regulator [Elusimicrobiota bacterium]
GNHFLVTVYKERISGLVQIPGKGLVEKVPEKTKGETRETTRETTRERILIAIKANPIATALELSKLLNLTAKGVEWNLRKLKNDGLLKRIGPDFGGHWEVVPSGGGHSFAAPVTAPAAEPPPPVRNNRPPSQPRRRHSPCPALTRPL